MLKTVPGLRIIGTAAEKAGVISFVLDEFRAEDVGAALNQEGIALSQATTAPSLSCAVSALRQPSVRRWRCITLRRISTHSSPLSCVFRPREAIVNSDFELTRSNMGESLATCPE